MRFRTVIRGSRYAPTYRLGGLRGEASFQRTTNHESRFCAQANHGSRIMSHAVSGHGPRTTDHGSRITVLGSRNARV
jgi:hypothetical protein